MNTTTIPRHVARLVEHLEVNGSTTATNAELAAALGVTVRSIRYGITDGEALGVFTVERRASNAATDDRSGRTVSLVVTR